MWCVIEIKTGKIFGKFKDPDWAIKFMLEYGVEKFEMRFLPDEK